MFKCVPSVLIFASNLLPVHTHIRKFCTKRQCFKHLCCLHLRRNLLHSLTASTCGHVIWMTFKHLFCHPLCYCRCPPWRSSCNKRWNGGNLLFHPPYCRQETEQKHQHTTQSNPGKIHSRVSDSNTHGSIPKSVHSLTLLFKIWCVLLCATETNTTVRLMVFYWCFVQRRPLNSSRSAATGDVIQQLLRKRQQPADYWQPSALDPCSTYPRTSCSYLRRNPNHCRILLQTESGCSAGTKLCQLFGLDSSTFILTVEDTKRMKVELSIMKELHCVFSQKQAQILLITWHKASFTTMK